MAATFFPILLYMGIILLGLAIIALLRVASGGSRLGLYLGLGGLAMIIIGVFIGAAKFNIEFALIGGIAALLFFVISIFRWRRT